MEQLGLNLAPRRELVESVEHRVNPRRGTPWDRITMGIDASPQWVVSALDKAEHGDMTDLVLLNRRMEERLPGYAGALGQLKYPLTQADVRIRAASDDPQDVEMAETVKRVIDSDNFHLVKPDMLDALGVGFSILEQRWGDRKGAFVPVEWHHVRPDIFRWGANGHEPELSMGGGVRKPLAHGRWVRHISKIRTALPVNAGLGKTVAMFYLFYNRAWLSYAAFADIFGLPLRVGYYNAGDSAQDVAALEAALHAMGSDAVAVIKQGMTYKIERSNASGNAGSDRFFADYIDVIEDQVIKAVLGQSMTSSNEGGSLAKAEVAERGKNDQIRALGFQLSASWRSWVVRPLVDLNLGPDREAPQVWLDVEDGDDIKALAEGLAPFIDRGLPVLAADILDRSGLPVPQDMPEDLLLHPENGNPSETASAVALKAESEKMSRLIMQICNTIDNERDMRSVVRVLAPELKAAGYSLKRAA